MLSIIWTIVKIVFTLLLLGGIITLIVLVVKGIIKIPYVNDFNVYVCADGYPTTFTKKPIIGSCPSTQITLMPDKGTDTNRICIWEYKTSTTGPIQFMTLGGDQPCQSTNETLKVLHQGYVYNKEASGRKKICIKVLNNDSGVAIDTNNTECIPSSTMFPIWTN
jgi:hypothetical protein